MVSANTRGEAQILTSFENRAAPLQCESTFKILNGRRRAHRFVGPG